MNIPRTLALVSVVMLAIAGEFTSSATPLISDKEKTKMSNPPSISRPPAPIVAPVEHAGIRYEQDSTDDRQGDAAGGYLAAFDTKSNAKLWRIKVYDALDHRAAGIAAGPGAIYFRSMSLAPDGTALEIENEVGGRYLVDLTTRTSVQVGGPAPTATAPSKPVPPKPIPQ